MSNMNIGLLDFSEFPSLSGAPQSQQQNATSQAIWGNPGIRAPQNTTGPRAMNPNTTTMNAPHTIRPPSQTSHAQSHRQPEAQEESRTSPFPQLGSGLDDFPFGHAGNTQPNRESDPQGKADEFPPLGGLGVAGPGQMRRIGIMNDAHLNGATNGDAFGSMSTQNRIGSSRPSNPNHEIQPQNPGGDNRFPTLDGSPRGNILFHNLRVFEVVD